MRNTSPKKIFSSAWSFLFPLICILGIYFPAATHAKQQKYASSGKAFEVNVSVSDDGTAYLAFEDRRNQNRIRVRKLSGSTWQDLAGGSAPKGLISPDRGSNPVLETRDEEVYAAFIDKSDANRARVKKWNGTDWQDLAGANHPEGKISQAEGFEPEIKFNKSKTNLYAAFRDETNGYKIRVMRWNGAEWENCADAEHPLGLASENAGTEVAIAASQTGDGMYIAYEDIVENHRVKVKHWNGVSWTDVSDALHTGGYLSTESGFSPSIAADSQDNLFAGYTNPKLGALHIFRWNGSGWSEIERASAKKSSEISLAVDGNDNLWAAFSEKYLPRRQAGKRGRWRLKLKKISNGTWISVPKNKANFTIAKGKNLMDPSLAFASGNIYLAYTNPGNNRKARVVSYNALIY